MKTLKTVIIAAVSCLVLAVGVLLCVLPRPTYSDTEKRPLASFPTFSVESYLSGDFTSGINAYYNDTIPGRDFFKDLTGRISKLFGLRPDDVKIYIPNGGNGLLEGDEETTEDPYAVTMPEDAEPALPNAPKDTEEATDTEPVDTEAPVTEEPGTDTAPVTNDPAETEDIETEPVGTILAVVIDKTHLDLYTDREYTFDVRLRQQGTPEDRTVTITADPPYIVSIDGFTVRGIQQGETTLTFSAANGVTTTCTVSVTIDPNRDTGAVVDDYLAQYGVIISGTRAMSLYGGSYNSARTYMASLESYYQDLGGEVNVYSMVIPTASEFYCPDSYASYNASQQKMCNYIRDNLSGNVRHVEVYTPLSEHCDEDIYLRTDHHWAPLGAYYAAKAFAETAGVPFADLSTFDAHVIEGFLGTMYSVYTQDPILLENPEDFVYYTPTNVSYTTTYQKPDGTGLYTSAFFIPMSSRGGAYCTFMGGDDKITHVSTQAGTGRKLVIIKESFGNALPGYLFGSFDDIYIIDLRYFELNTIEFIKETGATDLLFATCTFTATGPASLFERMRVQAP